MSRALLRSATALVVALPMATLQAHAAPEDGERGENKFRQIDTDHDGKISRQEAAAYPRLAKKFDRIDANKDGFITWDELKTFRRQNAAEHFKAIDINGDGLISRAEAEAKAPKLAKRFDQLDTNQDGFLSKDEMKLSRASQRELERGQSHQWYR